MSENGNRVAGMPADTRLLTGALAGAAEIVKLVTEQLPGACTFGTAPDHVFQRITPRGAKHHPGAQAEDRDVNPFLRREY